MQKEPSSMLIFLSGADVVEHCKRNFKATRYTGVNCKLTNCDGGVSYSDTWLMFQTCSRQSYVTLCQNAMDTDELDHFKPYQSVN